MKSQLSDQTPKTHLPRTSADNPGKLLKYKSTYWCKLKKNEISKLTDEYYDTNPNSQDVNTNRTFFRDNLTTPMNNTIPHCNTKAKTHLPWISRELIRMQRRRNKSHKKAKQTGLNKHWEQFRELRRHTTKTLATSYKSYVNNQMGDSLKTSPNRFWSFIKANKRWHSHPESLYYKRVDPYLCSELAPVLEGSGSRHRYPRKGTRVDRVSVVFVALVDRRIFLLFAQKQIRGGGAFAEGTSAPLKQRWLLL